MTTDPDAWIAAFHLLHGSFAEHHPAILTHDQALAAIADEAIAFGWSFDGAVAELERVRANETRGSRARSDGWIALVLGLLELFKEQDELRANEERKVGYPTAIRKTFSDANRRIMLIERAYRIGGDSTVREIARVEARRALLVRLRKME